MQGTPLIRLQQTLLIHGAPKPKLGINDWITKYEEIRRF